MRIDVKKRLLMGPSSVRDRFFKRAQELGIIEFISYTPPSLETPHEIQNFVDALHILSQMVPVKQVPTEDYRSAKVLARHVVERKHELEHLEEQRRIHEKEIDRIEVFGDFSIDNLHSIEHGAHRVIQFFFCKKPEELEAPKNPEVLFIGRAHDLSYFVTINKERKTYEGMIEILIEKSVGELREELAHIDRQIDEYEAELASLAHKKSLLKQGLVNMLNRYHLEDAKGRAESLLDDEIFAVEGWIPKNKLPELQKVADEFNVHIEEIQIEKKDRTPTYLENKRFGRMGEDLVSIYDTPSKTDRDPSLWVFIAFGIFFSMIVADAGYGLVLLALSLFLFIKFGKKGGLARRTILLLTSLSVGCIIWGVQLTSFFGIEVSPTNDLRKVSIVHWMVEAKADYFLEKKPASYTELLKDYPSLNEAKTAKELLTSVTKKLEHQTVYPIYKTFTNNVLIELAIFIGTIHLMLSFLRYLDRHWAGIGWVLFMVGCYLFFPLILGAVSLIHYCFYVPYEAGGEVGKYLLYSGLGLTVVLALIQHRLRGLGEIMNVIGVFADVMSYLRIYALSLAGMIMASTFDEIGTDMPLYIGIFVILAGHLINITLAVMGGVIHGLRLNFIEWYHYSFEGGGRVFVPLSLKKID